MYEVTRKKSHQEKPGANLGFGTIVGAALLSASSSMTHARMGRISCTGKADKGQEDPSPFRAAHHINRSMSQRTPSAIAASAAKNLVRIGRSPRPPAMAKSPSTAALLVIISLW